MFWQTGVFNIGKARPAWQGLCGAPCQFLRDMALNHAGGAIHFFAG